MGRVLAIEQCGQGVCPARGAGGLGEVLHSFDGVAERYAFHRITAGTRQGWSGSSSCARPTVIHIKGFAIALSLRRRDRSVRGVSLGGSSARPRVFVIECRALRRAQFWIGEES